MTSKEVALGVLILLVSAVACLIPTLIILVVAAALAVLGWLIAGVWLKPRQVTVEAHPAIKVAQSARSIVGGTFVAGAALGYGGNVTDILDHMIENAAVALELGIAALVVGITVFAVLSPAGWIRRRVLRSAARYPAIAVSAMIAVIALIVSLNRVYAWSSTKPGRDSNPLLNVFTVGFHTMAFLGVMGLTAGFGIRAVYLLTKNVFNAADVHPLLPVVLAPAIAWVQAVMAMVQPGVLPAGAERFVAPMGALTVTILAGLEWFHYRNRSISVRTGPYPGSRMRYSIDLREPPQDLGRE